MPPPRTFRPCRHLFTGGHQCGSPALRGEELCFYHHATRRPLKPQVLHGRTRAALPEPLDLHAIQRGLAELLRLTAADLIDLRLASQLHRQLSSASQNLARIERAEARADARAEALNLDRHPVTDYLNHPTLGTIAPPQAAEVQPVVQTEVPSVQTEPQSNEDFETSQETSDQTPHPHEAGHPTAAPEPGHPTAAPEPGCPTAAPEPGCPTFGTVPSCLRWDSTDPAQAPLPDPVARFTLPPEPEFLEGKAAHDAAYQAYADAYQALAQGIHSRAQARAQHHAALFPLEDTQVRLEDEEDLEYDAHLSQLVEHLQSEQESTAA